MKWVWSVCAALLCLAASARGEGVANLIKQLKDPEASTRRTAAQALGEIGTSASDAVPALTKALNDNRREVQEAAAAALGKIGPGSVQALIGVAKDRRKDAMVRRKAVESLAAMGAAARPAVPGLVEIISGKPGKGGKKQVDPNTDVRVGAVQALARIAAPDDKTALDALKALTDRKQNNRPLKQAANVALRQIKNNSK